MSSPVHFVTVSYAINYINPDFIWILNTVACQVTVNCTAEQSRAVLAASCVNTSATDIANECEAYIQDSNEMELACEAVRMEADSKQAELEVWLCVYYSTDHFIFIYKPLHFLLYRV